MHPAFNSSGGTQRHAQTVEDSVTGRSGIEYGITVSRYLDIPPLKGEAIAGQVEPQVSLGFPKFKSITRTLIVVLFPPIFERDSAAILHPGLSIGWL